MKRAGPGSYLLALAGVAAVAGLTFFLFPIFGTASAALLFLLPVLQAATRGGLGPGLFAAIAGALAYNFFLLPPRFTLRIHTPENVVNMLVLIAVAIVTSRLATALKQRKAQALAQARENAEAADFSALLGRGDLAEAIDDGMNWLAAHYGQSVIMAQGLLPAEDAGYSTLDLSAAAWAMHNSDRTGHGTDIMPAADWTFVPLSPRGPAGSDILAIARPADGTTRPAAQLAQLQALARLTGQARDRLALDEERRARERLEDRDALRRTLLASLAHDFRTPLTVVAGELERLARTDTGAGAALAEAQRLDRMMADLLGAARIENGALAPHREAVDIVDLVADSRTALARALTPLTVDLQLDHDLPLIDADPVLLRHVLINLMDNAARHATSSVTVAACAGKDGIELSVEDDGPGIPPAERQRIFERFTRIEGDDRQGGSGLGLAIVKGFADAMGMAVCVENGSKGGSRFSLTMPARDVVVS